MTSPLESKNLALPEIRGSATTGPRDIKRVPAERAVRERIRAAAIRTASAWDKAQPFLEFDIESRGRALLAELGLSEIYLGWTMVALGSAFWRDQVVATPHHRRLLLLPHCLRDLETCPARFDERQLLCQNCGRCRLGEFRDRAERLGYHVLLAEGSPVVMQIILAGEADAILGVSCLDVLERSLERILAVGIPCMAIPLHGSTCGNSKTDEDWLLEMIDTPYRPAVVETRTYVHLWRAATRLFDPDELARLAPPVRDDAGPLGSTEALARDFLLAGGKRSRPFVTLATYDAMTGARATGSDGADHVGATSVAIRRVALAMEVFHKASLVHDDIEDDDAFRYGRPTLHRQHGLPTALNLGDYLIGLGYRLVATSRDTLGAEVAADILAELARAHTRLCEGQGAELAWRESSEKPLAPLDALTIYALKTAPAFEVALLAGLRMATPVEPYREPIARFARHLGVAFQIRNDLDDWQSAEDNKRTAGGDVLGARPTVLWALAMEALGNEGRRELQSLAGNRAEDGAALERVRELYTSADVFQKAETLVAKHRRRAWDIADELQPADLGRLLHYLAESILH